MSGYTGLIGVIGRGGSSYGINLNCGPEGGGGGASHASKLSKSVSSIVKSSAKSSSSDSIGIEGLAGGGGVSNCCVSGISMFSIIICPSFSISMSGSNRCNP